MGLFSSQHSQFTVLLVGLDQAGKSTFLQQLKGGSGVIQQEPLPTIGFDIQEIKTKYEHLLLRVIDIGGQGRYRSLWDLYAPEAEAVIFVIDSTDSARFCVVRDELVLLMRNSTIRQVPILFVANKADLVEAVTPAELGRIFGLQSLIHNTVSWAVFPVSAQTGEGMAEVEQWLLTSLVKKT